MRALKLTLLALVVSVAPAWAQAQQGVPRWPGITMPTFVIPASAVSGSGGVSSSLIPTVDNSFDLGSSSFRWRSIYWGTQALGPDGTAGAPSYSFASNTGVGWYHTGTGASSVLKLSIDGTNTWQTDKNGVLYIVRDTAAIQMGAALDVSLSRGAADRLDLATGDSFRIVSGGLGVGTTNTTAGTITTSAGITAGTFVYAEPGSAMGWGGSRSIMTSPADGKYTITTNNGTSGILSFQFTDNPTCATNCGTSPTLTGVDSSFTLTMGGTGSPASGFVITFNGTWAAAPQCTAVMAKTGMAVGKLPMVIVTTTTTATVTTNGVAPANSDMYHFQCSLGQ